MIFTGFGRAIAWLMVVLGGFQAGLAVYFIVETEHVNVPRYFGSKTLGEVLDQSVIVILLGVVVGMVAEISRSVAAKAEVTKQELE